LKDVALVKNLSIDNPAPVEKCSIKTAEVNEKVDSFLMSNFCVSARNVSGCWCKYYLQARLATETCDVSGDVDLLESRGNVLKLKKNVVHS
jgi:hypothetical protein